MKIKTYIEGISVFVIHWGDFLTLQSDSPATGASMELDEQRRRGTRRNRTHKQRNKQEEWTL